MNLEEESGSGEDEEEEEEEVSQSGLIAIYCLHALVWS